MKNVDVMKMHKKKSKIKKNELKKQRNGFGLIS